MSAEAAALTEFPELRRLVDLREAGWLFMSRVTDGEIMRVDGTYVWPDNSADAIMVRYTSDAAALRCDPAGGLVWQEAGGLVEVIEALLTLPAPGTAGAPRLVRGAGPALWTP